MDGDPKVQDEKSKKSPHAYVDPPLVSFSVTNPVNYLRKWWYRVISREGIDVRFRIHPVTAFAILATVASLGFGVGRFTIPEPIVKLIPQLAPTPTPDPWRETAYSGVLQKANGGKYYLVVGTSAEAVTLVAPSDVDLTRFVGKRIFAQGKYNDRTKVFVVSDASSMEVLLQVAPVVKRTPTPSPKPTIEPTPEASSSATPTPSP